MTLACIFHIHWIAPAFAHRKCDVAVVSGRFHPVYPFFLARCTAKLGTSKLFHPIYGNGGIWSKRIFAMCRFSQFEVRKRHVPREQWKGICCVYCWHVSDIVFLRYFTWILTARLLNAWWWGFTPGHLLDVHLHSGYNGTAVGKDRSRCEPGSQLRKNHLGFGKLWKSWKFDRVAVYSIIQHWFPMTRWISAAEWIVVMQLLTLLFCHGISWCQGPPLPLAVVFTN